MYEAKKPECTSMFEPGMSVGYIQMSDIFSDVELVPLKATTVTSATWSCSASAALLPVIMLILK